MKSKFRIAVLGLGGVGGYIGGKLAAHYASSKEVEIIFIARGENEKAIQSNGLRLITTQDNQVVYPSLITSDPLKIGTLDLIVCTTKSYDLEKSLELILNSVTARTIVLPFLNGVDAAERIKKIFPQTEVWEGCIYIVSRLMSPGVVKESGNINKLFFGAMHESKEMLSRVETLFKSAGINAQVSQTITQTLWDKFIFISPLATLTSYLNLCIGDIMSNESHAQTLFHLITELKNVADAADILLSENIVEKTWNRMTSLPYETTSSMRDDFQKGHNAEVDSLTGYVVRLGKKLQVPTPFYDEMLSALNDKLQMMKLGNQ